MQPQFLFWLERAKIRAVISPARFLPGLTSQTRQFWRERPAAAARRQRNELKLAQRTTSSPCLRARRFARCCRRVVCKCADRSRCRSPFVRRWNASVREPLRSENSGLIRELVLITSMRVGCVERLHELQMRTTVWSLGHFVGLEAATIGYNDERSRCHKLSGGLSELLLGR